MSALSLLTVVPAASSGTSTNPAHVESLRMEPENTAPDGMRECSRTELARRTEVAREAGIQPQGG